MATHHANSNERLSHARARSPAFILDLDGTLVDSVYQHVLAWSEALERARLDLSIWRIHRRIGMSGVLFVNALSRESGRRVSRQRRSSRSVAPPRRDRRENTLMQPPRWHDSTLMANCTSIACDRLRCGRQRPVADDFTAQRHCRSELPHFCSWLSTGSASMTSPSLTFGPPAA
jgi:hypothetical protein